LKTLRTFTFLISMALFFLAWGGQCDTPSGGQASVSAIPATQSAIAPKPGARHTSTATAAAGANVHGHHEINGSGYVFLDDATKATYNLDHQDQLSKYKLDGKKVQIVGTLETASNTIHVTKIAVLS